MAWWLGRTFVLGTTNRRMMGLRLLLTWGRRSKSAHVSDALRSLTEARVLIPHTTAVSRV